MLFNTQNMWERRIEIILERFEVNIDGNSCKDRSMLHIGEGVWEVSISNMFYIRYPKLLALHFIKQTKHKPATSRTKIKLNPTPNIQKQYLMN